MTPRRVSHLPLHTSARVAGTLGSRRDHVHSLPISVHHIPTLILVRVANGICYPRTAPLSPANTIQGDQIACAVRLRSRMSAMAVVVPAQVHVSRVRESDEPRRVHSALRNPALQ